MRTVVYGFFKDEMRGSHDYYEVASYMLFFFIVDLTAPIIFDPFFSEGESLILDLVDTSDILPYLFLSFIPLIYFAHYKSINGFALVQAMFLYVFLLGWLPLLYEELFNQDSFFFFINLMVFYEYFLLNEDEDELDDLYGDDT